MPMDPSPAPAESDVTAAVRAHYAAVAEGARAAAEAGARPAGCGCDGTCFGAAVYPLDALQDLPAGAVAGSQGCGNPTALAELREGEVVLDLGSGGGIDVILSARRVGPTGRAYGLDMTDEMLALAEENARAAGVANVRFLRGRIEDIPLPDRSVDVIISNCVVNLSADKGRVLAEAFRVLRPGGRLAVSDIVIRDAGPGEAEMPPAVRRSIELWAGCIAGALGEGEYRAELRRAGFEGIEVEEVRRYAAEDIGEPLGRTLADSGLPGDPASAAALAGRFASAFVRAVRPRDADGRTAPLETEG